MIVGRRSFSFGSQYLSENVTSDSDTWPSESHALIISTSSYGREIFSCENSPLVLKLPKNKESKCQYARLKTDSAERERPSPARRARLGIASHPSREWLRTACRSHLPPNAPSYSHSV